MYLPEPEKESQFDTHVPESHSTASTSTDDEQQQKENEIPNVEK